MVISLRSLCQSTTRFFSPCFIVDVLCFPHVFAILVLIFFVLFFQEWWFWENTPQKPNAKFTKFRWRPEAHVYSCFRRTHCASWNFETPFRRVYAKRPLFWHPPPGKGSAPKASKTQGPRGFLITVLISWHLDPRRPSRKKGLEGVQIST